MKTLARILNDLIELSKTNGVHYETIVGRIDYDVEGFEPDDSELSINLRRRGTTTILSLPLSEAGAWGIMQEMAKYCLRVDMDNNVYLQI